MSEVKEIRTATALIDTSKEYLNQATLFVDKATEVAERLKIETDPAKREGLKKQLDNLNAAANLAEKKSNLLYTEGLKHLPQKTLNVPPDKDVFIKGTPE